MKDDLIDALLETKETPFRWAEKVVDAVAAYVDARLIGVAKPQAESHTHHPDTGIDICDDCPNHPMKPEPRRNPYEDWNAMQYSVIDGGAYIRSLLVEAYDRGRSEGAQTEERDA